MPNNRALLLFLLLVCSSFNLALAEDFETLVTKGMVFSELTRGSDTQYQGLTKDFLNCIRQPWRGADSYFAEMFDDPERQHDMVMILTANGALFGRNSTLESLQSALSDKRLKRAYDSIGWATSATSGYSLVKMLAKQFLKAGISAVDSASANIVTEAYENARDKGLSHVDAWNMMEEESFSDRKFNAAFSVAKRQVSQAIDRASLSVRPNTEELFSSSLKAQYESGSSTGDLLTQLLTGEIQRQKDAAISRILNAPSTQVEACRTDSSVREIEPLASDSQFTPDLTVPWPSSYGAINWNKGWYGVKEKTLSYSGSWDTRKNVYVVSGEWGRTNSKDKGKFVFEFTTPCAFSGTWGNKSSATNGAEWSGTCSKPGSTEDTGSFKPDLEKTWGTSTFGFIDWSAGKYGSKEKTIDVSRQYWSPIEDAYIVEGQWGRTNSKRTGGFRFVFDDACSFSGRWWNGTAKSEGSKWAGRCD